jgi:hypothetical protein
LRPRRQRPIHPIIADSRRRTGPVIPIKPWYDGKGIKK